MRKIIFSVFILFVFACFVSCDDDDPTPQGYGDAYVISKLSDTGEEGAEPTVVYGLYMQAGALYGTLSSVNVAAGTSSYTLTKNSNTGVFEYETNYSTNVPAEGNYIFSYTFTTGENSSSSDALTDDVLIPATITTSAFSNDEIDLEWDEVEDADATYVLLRDADGDLVFSSVVNSYLAGDETEYTISRSAGAWDSDHTMTDGATYTVEIVALMADNVGSFQAMSIGSTTVVWGEETGDE